MIFVVCVTTAFPFDLFRSFAITLSFFSRRHRRLYIDLVSHFRLGNTDGWLNGWLTGWSLMELSHIKYVDAMHPTQAATHTHTHMRCRSVFVCANLRKRMQCTQTHILEHQIQ